MNAHKIKPTKMKKILTVLLLGLSMTMNSQWIKGEKKDAFDGNYKYTIVKGYGGDFPYATPSFTINRFANETPNVYISDMGSMACDNQILKIAIDDKIYSFNLSSSVDGDSGFLQGTNNEMIMLLNGLKKGNKAILRFTTRCSENTFKIGLTGSTSGINYVIGDYYKKKVEEEEELNKEEEELNKSIYPIFLEWKEKLDASILNIQAEYEVFFDNKVLSFEEFSEIIYDNFSRNGIWSVFDSWKQKQDKKYKESLLLTSVYVKKNKYGINKYEIIGSSAKYKELHSFSIEQQNDFRLTPLKNLITSVSTYDSWKQNLDNNILEIFSNNQIVIQYITKSDLTLELFKQLIYEELLENYTSLEAYYKYFYNSKLRDRHLVVEFEIKKYVGKTTILYFKKYNGDSRLPLKIKGEYVYVEKGENVYVEKSKLNNNKTCTFEKGYYGGDEFSVKGTVTFGENYLLIDIDAEGVDNVKIPILDENIKTNSSKWTFNYTANDITITYIFNAADYTYNTSGGTLTLKNSGSVKDIIYPLILSYTKKPFNPKKLP